MQNFDYHCDHTSITKILHVFVIGQLVPEKYQFLISIGPSTAYKYYLFRIVPMSNTNDTLFSNFERSVCFYLDPMSSQLIECLVHLRTQCRRKRVPIPNWRKVNQRGLESLDKIHDILKFSLLGVTKVISLQDCKLDIILFHKNSYRKQNSVLQPING